ncbi:hypothetical protein SAMN04488239_11120 [Ruegeria marina]|uniref:Uncharacterized protein n=1 Tax=Ruegeria marina TaxID=639004 RepID=A0A1G6Y4P8_9RHOB|nr:hypothetical protein SAMN04488239_11120 [Ruegeria marina]
MDFSEWSAADAANRATQAYLDTLDDAAFGAATLVKPKAISPADPATRLTGANGDRAFFAYSTNYLVDLDHAIIVDVEATAPIRQAEAGAVRDMLGWLVEEQDTEPHIPVFGQVRAQGRRVSCHWLHLRSRHRCI